MAKHYRDFKRVLMDAKLAKLLHEWSNRVLEDHYKRNCDTRGCFHKPDIVRLVLNGLTIGKKRARLDLPDSNEPLNELADLMNAYARTGIWVANYDYIKLRANKRETDAKVRAMERLQHVTQQIRVWANRGPLEKLAEAFD